MTETDDNTVRYASDPRLLPLLQALPFSGHTLLAAAILRYIDDHGIDTTLHQLTTAPSGFALSPDRAKVIADLLPTLNAPEQAGDSTRTPSSRIRRIRDRDR